MPEVGSPPPQQPLLGRLAVERGMVTQQQLDQILRIAAQLQGTQPIGALFVQKGLLTAAQVQELLRIQKQLEPQRAAAAPAAPAPVRPLAIGNRPAAPAAPAPLPPARTGLVMPVRGQTSPQPPPEPPRPVVATPPAKREQPTLEPELVADEEPLLRPIIDEVDPMSMAPISTGIVSNLIEAAERHGASDVHFHGGAPAALRAEGQLIVLNQPPMSPADQERELLGMLTEPQLKIFKDAGELDSSLLLPSGLRVRANIYRSLAGVDATFRIIARKPRTLEELHLPSSIARLTVFHQGLVLVTGPAGSGKTTTLAALIGMLNEERPEHILTFEDPIEIVHPHKRALVNQRQMGRDSESFARALRGALREDPDIIMIGDLRDRETIGLAITAAETGHLVIASMNTASAGRTVSRLIDAFPPSQQAQIRAMLSESLRGVVSQRLVIGLDGKRVPAVELLVVTGGVANLIREGKLFQIPSQMQMGKHVGMKTLDDSLRELVTAGKIDIAEARRHAVAPENFGAPPDPSGPQPAQGTGTTSTQQQPAARPGAPAARPAPAAPARAGTQVAIPRPPGRTS